MTSQKSLIQDIDSLPTFMQKYKALIKIKEDFNKAHEEKKKNKPEYIDNLQILYDIFYKEYDDKLNEINSAQVKKILERPQWKQRSNEWYNIRKTRLTASSDIAGIIQGSNIKVIEKKTGHGKSFKGNAYTYHGQKFEDIACAIYETRRGKKVHEVGFLVHETNENLGASPDGLTEDCRLLEIKVPSVRRINGEVKKCYYIQMQTQLQVCDAAICDFFECSIKYYTSKEEYDKDIFVRSKCFTLPIVPPTDNIDLIKLSDCRRTADGLEKGLIGRIGYRAAHTSNIYEYPPFNLTTKEQREWLENKQREWKKNGKKLVIDHWYLETSSLNEVIRDDAWWKKHDIDNKINNTMTEINNRLGGSLITKININRKVEAEDEDSESDVWAALM